MDTLRGEWGWIKTLKPKHGIVDSEFKSILKVLDQNEDASISYEVFVEDTLFFKGDFQIEQGQWYRKANIKLPHNLPSLEENWIFRFVSILSEMPSKDTLRFWSGAIDDYYYYYQKIKQKE
jgi:hypothetical protein